ncbi:MAG: xanthine dehydrogenase family protein molybdopterin-binding subunit [Actinomycetota bacterium]|nr:xanthine dehydrogenase family protein molybdopterin-binding subunit [Actinomycetota bacterium]
MGQRFDRVDGIAKTTGTAQYSAEYQFAEIAHAVLVHASITRGKIVSLDTSAALAQQGVVTVVTHLNAPKLVPPPTRLNPLDLSSMAAGSSIAFLNTDEIHVDGQPIAVVVADTLEAAEHAAGLVRATYAELPASTDFDAEIPNATIAKGLPVGPALAGKKGDATTALAQAPVRVDLQFSTPQHNHNALEPHSTTAAWAGDRLTVYEGSQNIDWVQKFLAKRFDIPAKNVHVIATFVGGAFGGKTMVWAGTLLACLAAKVARRPVRLALTREGVYRTVGGRTPTRQRVAIGAQRDGTMTALIHTCVTRQGKVGGAAEQVTACSQDLYDAQNILAEQKVIELDLLSNTAMRAPGESVGTFAIESAVDELAYALDMDPLTLRLNNQPTDRSPVTGNRYSHRRLAETLRRGGELFGWADRPEPGTRDGNQLIGWGVAAAIHPSWEFVANVELTIDATGRVTLKCAFHEMGMGSATAVGQIVADQLGVPYDTVVVQYGDSALPIGPGAGGSAQTASLAGSIERAAQKLRGRLQKLAKASGISEHAEPADILAKAGRPSLTVAVGSDTGPVAVAGQLKFLSKMLIDGRRWMKAASGAQFCEVRVDVDTGEVRVTRWVAVFDVGRVINPKTTESQLRGGIVMGLGLAMTEDALVDPRTGRIMNPSLAEYHVPVHADVPYIGIELLDDPDPQMPLGVLGAGEVGITGVGAAVGNAVRHATGRRVLDLPITLDKIS